MRTLRDEVINRGIPVVDFTSALEIILDENGKAQFVAKGVGGLLGRTAKNDLKVLIKGI